MKKFQFLEPPAPGSKSTSATDSHMKTSNFTAEINAFQAWNKANKTKKSVLVSIAGFHNRDICTREEIIKTTNLSITGETQMQCKCVHWVAALVKTGRYRCVGAISNFAKLVLKRLCELDWFRRWWLSTKGQNGEEYQQAEPKKSKTTETSGDPVFFYWNNWSEPLRRGALQWILVNSVSIRG